ncbi:Vms1/Ankzf1 family peptidyl-tRNA hydrolase [Haloterrigena salifodinae]|uniref:Vms1/Ankzf1 family peptidyl-tRNA hydrolase n=1 Tax=Haloterrigena salifodinae TaxID=2675099 RepID=UPI000F8983CD|nr:Vms1/Ankzf1 family peptidyl-tRNA hydrolase [Haloterrigena salifodinae]
MLDALLGRASLKERIDELEEKNERLRNRYEAESERRSEAATARQDAEERVNRLEDRIAQLEGELEQLEGDEAGLSVRRRERLRGSRLEAVVDRLASFRTGPEGALTAILREDESSETLAEEFDVDLETPLGDRAALVDEAAPCVLCLDDAGLIAATLEPPAMPDRALEDDSRIAWDDRFRFEREWFLPTGRYALALVRTDLFALGTYEDGDRVDYRGFESDVKGNHSKGGFSQARFERIRDDQIDDHLERCREALSERVDDGDRLYLAGQRGVVETLAEDASLEPAGTAAVDATGDPKSALEDAHRSFWTAEFRAF